MSKKHLIILIHGIRDSAFWQGSLKDLFEKQPNVVVKTIKTDVIDIFRFVSPITIFRDKFINKVRSNLHSILFDTKYKEYKITIISHSFGTYIVSNILHEETALKIDQLIMCGGIVKNDFRWDRVRKINIRGSGDKILNEFSPNDIWPILAHKISFGYGNSGSKGCGNPDVTDRKHYLPHSQYLNAEFAKDYWLPYIHYDTILPGPLPKRGQDKEPWYFAFTRIPFNLMGMALSTLFVVILGSLVYGIMHTGNLQMSIRFEKSNLERSVRPELELWGRKSEEPDLQLSSLYLRPDHNNTSPNVTAISAVSFQDVDGLRLVFRNRPSMPSCLNNRVTEDEDSSIDSDWRDNQTEYNVRFQSKSMIQNILEGNWRGLHKIYFEYDPDVIHGDMTQSDLLKIHPRAGIAEITAVVENSEGSCTVPIEVAQKQHEVVVRKSQGIGWLSAFAATITQHFSVGDERDFVEGLFSENEKERTRAYDQLKTQSRQYNSLILKIVTNIADLDEERIVEFLSAVPLMASPPMELMDGASLDAIFSLTWDDRRRVRGAARRILRNRLFASFELAEKLKSRWRIIGPESDPDKIVDDQYRREYLAHISIRDVYYNSAMNDFLETREFGGDGGTIRKVTPKAVATLQSAGWLIDESPNAEKPAMAKNLYGVALILIQQLFIEDATNGKFQEMSAVDIIKSLDSKKSSRASVNAGSPAAKELIKAFRDFLTIADVQGGYYPWKRHISQAKSCVSDTQKISFSCLTTE